MLKLIDKGKGDRENWREIGDLMERKRKLSESQLKLLVTKQEFISRQQAVAMVALITGAIKESVSDPKEKRQIMSAIQQLMSLNEGQAVGDTGGLRDLV
jgi:ABC-type nitrate/sulfonate/bicarbonate transport system substrate-binding protein